MQHRRPIAYASKGLTTTERNYSKIENECIKNIFYVYIYIYIYYILNILYISPQWLCGNSCNCAHNVQLHIAGTNEPKSAQQAKLGV